MLDSGWSYWKDVFARHLLRKVSVLVMSYFLFLFSHQQAFSQTSGQWGVCEFATTSALNSFNPSSSDWDCKFAYCQADSNHYFWDGHEWIEAMYYNIYNKDGKLRQSRTIDLDGNDLIFTLKRDGSNQIIVGKKRLTIGMDAKNSLDMFISSKADMNFSVDNNNNSNDLFSWGSNANPDLGLSDSNYNQWMLLSKDGLRLSDYGSGSFIDTATYILAVDTVGDVIELNTARSSRVFYPPAIAIDASSTGTGLSLDLHQEYVNRYGSPAVKSSSAPAVIPNYTESELYYYVTDYDTAVFSNLSISDAGVLSYDIIASPADDFSLINVVFVVK